MSDQLENATKMTRAEWIAIAAFLVSLATTVFNLGVIYADVRNHDRRLTIVENSNSDLVRKVERIDANVSFLADLAREERNRR